MKVANSTGWNKYHKLNFLKELKGIFVKKRTINKYFRYLSFENENSRAKPCKVELIHNWFKANSSFLSLLTKIVI